jgi:CelD/BcsL family acetyltransferase involved in cellulose biosynthesis
LDYVIGGYHADAKYAKYSPGLVLDEDWMKVAFDQRLDVDFGAGQEPYKLLWSRGNKHEMANYRIPITFQGATLLAVWRQWRMFRDRLEKRRAG